MGYDKSDPFVEGWLKIEQDGNDTLIKLDKDGGGDNFDTLVVRLQDFTLEDFKRENIDPESTIWTSSVTPSSSVVSNNTSISSLDSSDDDLGIEIPIGVDITSGTDVLDEGTSFLNSFLWVHEFDINSITLPETVMDGVSTESVDLNNLIGLLGEETDSFALNFEAFTDDTGIEIEAVKPVDLSTSDPVLDHYQDSWLEDLVYSPELG